MENATKALIIAGAVLISILLISVGIMVFNAANDPINQAQNSSEQQAVQMFNESFNSYLGEEITGQQAKSLLSTIIASNGKNADHQIDYSGGITSLSAINTKYKYKAIEEIDANTGYITKITISRKTK